ncbi:hypothetical protein DdX_09758 [Ditylenchus destructor]|uniref:Uncharacterized protein n=1 Tax=Ditylenchus destructor TaxID=166010 RepID=A0AAD4N1C5_9BILA|nr:hypothetical protein DdX_09758 [Ditylenchus destructor]
MALSMEVDVSDVSKKKYSSDIIFDEAMAAKKLALGAGDDTRISFVRGESRITRQARTDNPEEIDIDDVDENETEEEDKEKSKDDQEMGD